MKKLIPLLEKETKNWTQCAYLSAHALSRVDALLSVLVETKNGFKEDLLASRLQTVYEETMPSRISSAQRISPFDLKELIPCFLLYSKIDDTLQKDIWELTEIDVRSLPHMVSVYRIFLYRTEICLFANQRTMLYLKKDRPEAAEVALQAWDNAKVEIDTRLAKMQLDLAAASLGSYL